MSGNPDSGIRKNFGYGIWVLESGIQLKESGIPLTIGSGIQFY